MYNKSNLFFSDTEKANPVPCQAHWLELMGAQHPVIYENDTLIQYKSQINVNLEKCTLGRNPPPQTNTEFKNIFHTLFFGIFVAPRKEN